MNSGVHNNYNIRKRVGIEDPTKPPRTIVDATVDDTMREGTF